jgi:hypothetical protein
MRPDRMDVQVTVKVAASLLCYPFACLVLVLGRTGPHHSTWSRPDALPSAGVHLAPPLHFKFLTPTAGSFALASHKRSGFLIS